MAGSTPAEKAAARAEEEAGTSGPDAPAGSRAKAESVGTIKRTKLGTGKLVFQTTTRHSREFRTWFRGDHTNFNPTLAQLLDVEASKRFVLQGWAPEAPMIRPETQVTAFGSCFAANISEWLSSRHYSVLGDGADAKAAYVVTCGEGMVNSFVIRQQFEWAWENRSFDLPLWHGYDAEDYGYDPAVQAETKRIFDETEFFILTFGLSEVWYDEPTGEVFWRTIPKDAYDPERHRFRVSTVEENRDNLRAIYRLIRKHRPDAKILFTLSPIPLIATFRGNSCITSNSVSKAVLRVAIDEVLREVGHEGHLYYWPSYELVTDVFRSSYRPDRRHPDDEVLNYIMMLFEDTWCTGTDLPRPPLNSAWALACAAAGILPARMVQILRSRQPRRLRLYLAEKRLTQDPKVDAALRALGHKVLAEWRGSAGPGEAE